MLWGANKHQMKLNPETDANRESKLTCPLSDTFHMQISEIKRECELWPQYNIHVLMLPKAGSWAAV